jgi:chromosome segregation ATPase
MRLPFGRRTAELETMNRILTDAARKRAERIKELEDQVAQLENQVAHLKPELESARKRATELEVVAAQRATELEVVVTQRAHLLNGKDERIAGAREALTRCSLRIRELENALLEIYKK